MNVVFWNLDKTANAPWMWIIYWLTNSPAFFSPRRPPVPVAFSKGPNNAYPVRNGLFRADLVIVAEPSAPPQSWPEDPSWVCRTVAEAAADPAPTAGLTTIVVREVDCGGFIDGAKEKLFFCYRLDASTSVLPLQGFNKPFLDKFGSTARCPIAVTATIGGATRLLAGWHAPWSDRDVIPPIRAMLNATTGPFAAADFRIANLLGDFNAPATQAYETYALKTPAGALTAITRQNGEIKFTNAYDRVYASLYWSARYGIEQYSEDAFRMVPIDLLAGRMCGWPRDATDVFAWNDEIANFFLPPSRPGHMPVVACF